MRLAPALLMVLVACTPGGDACVGATCERVTVTLEQRDARLVIDAEIADTPAERSQGLRGRTELAEDAGMLFLFEDQSARTFTMEDVLIPLDLLMIRAGRVVEVIEMVPCESSGASCLYQTDVADAALEVPGGTASQAGIGVGGVVAAGELL